MPIERLPPSTPLHPVAAENKPQTIYGYVKSFFQGAYNCGVAGKRLGNQAIRRAYKETRNPTIDIEKAKYQSLNPELRRSFSRAGYAATDIDVIIESLEEYKRVNTQLTTLSQGIHDLKKDLEQIKKFYADENANNKSDYIQLQKALRSLVDNPCYQSIKNSIDPSRSFEDKVIYTLIEKRGDDEGDITEREVEVQVERMAGAPLLVGFVQDTVLFLHQSKDTEGAKLTEQLLVKAHQFGKLDDKCQKLIEANKQAKNELDKKLETINCQYQDKLEEAKENFKDNNVALQPVLESIEKEFEELTNKAFAEYRNSLKEAKEAYSDRPEDYVLFSETESLARQIEQDWDLLEKLPADIRQKRVLDIGKRALGSATYQAPQSLAVLKVGGKELNLMRIASPSKASYMQSSQVDTLLKEYVDTCQSQGKKHGFFSLRHKQDDQSIKQLSQSQNFKHIVMPMDNKLWAPKSFFSSRNTVQSLADKLKQSFVDHKDRQGAFSYPNLGTGLSVHQERAKAQELFDKVISPLQTLFTEVNGHKKLSYQDEQAFLFLAYAGLSKALCKHFDLDACNFYCKESMDRADSLYVVFEYLHKLQEASSEQYPTIQKEIRVLASQLPFLSKYTALSKGKQQQLLSTLDFISKNQAKLASYIQEL